jgi:ABC-type phosphate/phosphonate transport system substrate-binding protein
MLMRLFVFLSIFGFALAPGNLAVAAEPAGSASDFKIGMLSGMFRDVSPNMVQSLAKPFRDLMSKQVGYSGEVEVIDNPLVLAEKLKDGKIQLGVFHGFEYAWAKQKCDDLIPLIVTRPPGGKVQALVVVNRASTAKTPADLKNETIQIPRGSKAHSLAFLDKTRIGFETTTLKPTPKVNQTPEEVLLAVATGEVNAALVDACALDGFKSLQPAAYKSLKVLTESEIFPPAVVCYRKGAISETEATRIRTGLTSAAKTSSGKMLMALWNLKGFEEPPSDYQSSLETILKAYPLPPEKTESAEKTVTKSLSSGGK